MRGRGGSAGGTMVPVLIHICALVGSWGGAAAGGAGGAGAGEAEPTGGSPPEVTLFSLITGTCERAQRYTEEAVRSGVMRSAVEFFEMVIRFLAEGAASGLNVIAVYVTEILRVTGFDAALTLPRFTPEGVTAIAQWGLLALVGYWVLTVVLRVLLCVARRVFWFVKTVLALWLFGLIVTDKTASADTTAVRVGFLVLACVVLTLLTAGSEKTCAVEQRLSTLENRLKVVEKRKAE